MRESAFDSAPRRRKSPMEEESTPRVARLIWWRTSGSRSETPLWQVCWRKNAHAERIRGLGHHTLPDKGCSPTVSFSPGGGTSGDSWIGSRWNSRALGLRTPACHRRGADWRLQYERRDQAGHQREQPCRAVTGAMSPFGTSATSRGDPVMSASGGNVLQNSFEHLGEKH